MSINKDVYQCNWVGENHSSFQLFKIFDEIKLCDAIQQILQIYEYSRRENDSYSQNISSIQYLLNKHVNIDVTRIIVQLSRIGNQKFNWI